MSVTGDALTWLWAASSGWRPGRGQGAGGGGSGGSGTGAEAPPAPGVEAGFANLTLPLFYFAMNRCAVLRGLRLSAFMFSLPPGHGSGRQGCSVRGMWSRCPALRQV